MEDSGRTLSSLLCNPVSLCMRIAFLTPWIPPHPEGVGQYTFQLSKALRRQGHDVHIFCGRHNTVSEETTAWIHPVLEALDPAAVKKAFAPFQEQIRFEGFCFQYVPQLYGKYGLCPRAIQIPGALKATWGLKNIVMVHEYGGEARPGIQASAFAWLIRWQTRLLLRSADLVFTNCERYCEALSKLMHSKVSVGMLPVGAGIEYTPLTPEARQALRSHYGLQGQRLFGFLGRFSKARPYEPGLQALKRMRREGMPVKCLVVGKAGGQDASLQSLLREAQSLGLKDDILITGRLSEPELSAHLQLLEAFYFSQCDGLSTRNTTLMSAASHGLPVIAYAPVAGNFGSLTYPHALLAKRGDTQAFEENLVSFFKRPALEAARQSEIQQFYQTHFSWQTLADQFWQTLKAKTFKL